MLFVMKGQNSICFMSVPPYHSNNISCLGLCEIGGYISYANWVRSMYTLLNTAVRMDAIEKKT